MSLVENKEHKPGPIGKERSLKNRKVKDAQQAEPEGQEKPSPAVVRSTDPGAAKETKAVSEMSADIGAMISVSSAEYGTDAKVGSMPWCRMSGRGISDGLFMLSIVLCWLFFSKLSFCEILMI